MLTPRSRPASTLFAPVRVDNILILDERIVYAERRHWAFLLSPFFETISILVFLTVLAGNLRGSLIRPMLFLLAGILTALMVVSKKWNKWAVYALLVVILAGRFVPDMFPLTALVVVGVASRFVYKFAMWAFYERLFITNRRLIFASGFLDSEIAMMPLTRITDISYKRPAIAELLGYGQLRVETAGQDQALGFIDYINHPNEFYELLINRSTTAVGAGPSSADDDSDGASGGSDGADGDAARTDPMDEVWVEPTEEIPFEGYGGEA